MQLVENLLDYGSTEAIISAAGMVSTAINEIGEIAFAEWLRDDVGELQVVDSAAARALLYVWGMSRVEPVDPRVRLAITQWPPDAPRGAVTTFCFEHGISRETFYAVRRRAASVGPAAALEPRSRRPKHSPRKLADDIASRAIAVRAALEQSGLEYGPISVHEKLRSLGMEPVPSTASLSRIFRDAGVAKIEPKKKPRSSYRRLPEQQGSQEEPMLQEAEPLIKNPAPFLGKIGWTPMRSPTCGMDSVRRRRV